MERWQAWLNIAFLFIVGVERWLLRHEVSVAVVAKDISTMKADIEKLHRKASDYGTDQQSAIGRVSIDIAVLKSEVVDIREDIKQLRRGGTAAGE